LDAGGVMLYSDEFVKTVLGLYAEGVCMLSIANFTGATVEVVNEVIDDYSPHL